MNKIILFCALISISFKSMANSKCSLNIENRVSESSLVYSIYLDGVQFTDNIYFFENAILKLKELESQYICQIQSATCSLVKEQNEAGNFTYAVKLNNQRITNWSFLTKTLDKLNELALSENTICQINSKYSCKIQSQKSEDGRFTYAVFINNEQFTVWTYLENAIQKRNLLISSNVCTL